MFLGDYPCCVLLRWWESLALLFQMIILSCGGGLSCRVYIVSLLILLPGDYRTLLAGLCYVVEEYDHVAFLLIILPCVLSWWVMSTAVLYGIDEAEECYVAYCVWRCIFTKVTSMPCSMVEVCCIVLPVVQCVYSFLSLVLRGAVVASVVLGCDGASSDCPGVGSVVVCCVASLA